MTKPNRFVRNLIYSLKRQYGSPLTIYKLNSSTADLKSGVKIVVKRNYEIKKAIILPSDIVRKFNFNLGYLAANKNFTYGATFDLNQKLILLDNKDIPSNLEITTNDFLVIKSQKFEVSKIELTDDGHATFLTVKEVLGDVPAQIHDLFLGTRLRFRQWVKI